MKKKLTILSAILSVSCLALPSYATDASYRAELTAAYGQDEVEDDFESDSSFYGIKGNYYFSDVNTRNHPLAEAAFLERGSNLYASWARTDYDIADDGTVDLSSVGVDFYVPATMLFLGAGIARLDVDDGFGSDNDSNWFAKLGIAPVDGLLIWTQLIEDVDISDYLNINAKYVVPLASENAINFEVNYEDWDNGYTETRVAADYYFTRSFSLGAGYTFSDFEDSYILQGRYFFSDAFSLQAGYGSSDSEDSMFLLANVRF